MNQTFDHTALRGLSELQVHKLLSTEGYNELPSAKKRGFIRIALEVMREPMFLLLLACGIIYLISGEVQEALMLLGFVFVVMGITFYRLPGGSRQLKPSDRQPCCALTKQVHLP
jgi:Ca2+-transporting ATPase